MGTADRRSSAGDGCTIGETSRQIIALMAMSEVWPPPVPGTALSFSISARHSLSLGSACSPRRHSDLLHRRLQRPCSSTAAPIATKWSGPVFGPDLHPLKTSAFHAATKQALAVPGESEFWAHIGKQNGAADFGCSVCSESDLMRLLPAKHDQYLQIKTHTAHLYSPASRGAALCPCTSAGSATD